MAQQVRVSILLTVRDQATKALKGISGAFKSLRGFIFSMKGLFAGIGVAAVAEVTKSLFNLGAEAEETANKFFTVFGSASGKVEEFNNTIGRLGGLSQSTGRAILATTGQIVEGMGFGQEAAADFAVEIGKIGTDIASFSNREAVDVIEAINSALVGERERLKSLGIVLLETDVQQRALANTGKRTATELTRQEKATATLQLITERAGFAIGDLQRTADSTANTMKRVAGDIQTAREKIGGMLKEAILASFSVGTLDEKTKSFNESLEKNKGVIVAWGAVIISTLIMVMSALKNTIKIVFNLGQSIGRIVLLTQRMGMAKNFDDIRKAWSQFTGGIKTDLMDVQDAFNNLDGSAKNLLNNVQTLQQRTGVFGDVTSGGSSSSAPALPTLPPIDTSSESGIKEQERKFKEMVDSINQLREAYQLGRIDAKQFANSWKEVTAAADVWVARGGLTEEQLNDLTSALKETSKVFAESKKVWHVDMMVEGANRLNAAFESGAITAQEYVSKMRDTTTAYDKALASGKLTDDEIIAINQSMKSFTDLMEKILNLPDAPAKLQGAVGLMGDLARQVKEIFGESASSAEVLADIGTQFMRDFGGAVEDAFAAAVSGTKDWGDAFKDGMLGAIGAVARGLGQLMLGKAAAALADGILGDPRGWAAAAKFGAAAALFFALAGTMSGLASKGGGAGGGRGAAATQAERVSETRPDATIYIQGGILDMSDPRQADALAEALSDLTDRRVIIKS